MEIPIEYEYVLEKTYALAHLPSNLIGEGMAHVTEHIDNVWQRNENHRQKLQTFGTYLRTNWVPLARVVSVFKKPIRTNNTCENFHMHAGKTMGNRPNIWKMLGKLINILVILRVVI